MRALREFLSTVSIFLVTLYAFFLITFVNSGDNFVQNLLMLGVNFEDAWTRSVLSYDSMSFFRNTFEAVPYCFYLRRS